MYHFNRSSLNRQNDMWYERELFSNFVFKSLFRCYRLAHRSSLPLKFSPHQHCRHQQECQHRVDVRLVFVHYDLLYHRAGAHEEFAQDVRSIVFEHPLRL